MHFEDDCRDDNLGEEGQCCARAFSSPMLCIAADRPINIIDRRAIPHREDVPLAAESVYLCCYATMQAIYML
jgi:hypothetical protein